MRLLKKILADLIKNNIFSILALTMIANNVTPVFASFSEYYQYSVNFTIEDLDKLWEKLTNQENKPKGLTLTDEIINALWVRVIENAMYQTTKLSQDELYVIEVFINEMKDEEQYLKDNLSPELLWKLYIEENPEILKKRGNQIDIIKEDLYNVYEIMVYNQFQEIEPMVSDDFDWVNQPLANWTRIFSRRDGLLQSSITAIESRGTASAALARIAFPFERHRQGAYRHWLWNHDSVRHTSVGSTLAQRTQRTRIYTTNREIATAVMRHARTNFPCPNIDVMNPTAQSVNTMFEIRQSLLGLNQWGWVYMMNTERGKEEQMDLWNNYWGRRDGVSFVGGSPGAEPIDQFNTRWVSTASNTGLARGPYYLPNNMRTNRQQRIWSQGKHFPF